MSQIQSIVEANEALHIAIEDYSAAVQLAKPSRYKGMSFAMEESSGDATEDKKKTMWEKFKAFFTRIKTWLMGLFKKRSAVIDQIDELKKDVDIKKAFNAEEAMKREAEKHSKAKEAAPQAQPAAKEEPAQATQPKPEPVKEAAAPKVAEQTPRGETQLKDANAAFSSSRAKITELAKNNLKAVLVSKFSGEFSDIMRIVMSVEGSGNDNNTGRQTAEALDAVRAELYSIGRHIANIAAGKTVPTDSGIGDAIDSDVVAEIKRISEGSDRGKQWVMQVQSHSFDEIIKGYKRYCGFVLNIAESINTRALRSIEKSLGDVLQETEKLLGSEGTDAESVRFIQKVYTEKVVPVNAGFNKILHMYVSACKQAAHGQHLKGAIINGVSAATKEVTGEDQYEHIDWQSTVGVLCNELTGFKK